MLQNIKISSNIITFDKSTIFPFDIKRKRVERVKIELRTLMTFRYDNNIKNILMLSSSSNGLRNQKYK